jgi:sigma-E factor negative regulatory protein RseC
MATRALLLAFGLPLVILLAVLFTVLSLTGREDIAALCGIGALLPYYGVLWLTRHRLQQRLAFWIEQ